MPREKNPEMPRNAKRNQEKPRKQDLAKGLDPDLDWDLGNYEKQKDAHWTTVVSRLRISPLLQRPKC